METDPFLHREEKHQLLADQPDDLPSVIPAPSRRRWIVLLVFMFLSVMNNLTQFSFSPLEEATRSYYNITLIELTMLALVYMISGFTTRFVAMWVIDNRGLGIGIVIAAILNLIGGWVRFYPGSDRKGYAWLLTGQCFCAISQSFIDIAGPKIAANWFPPKERATATALASGPIFMGVLIGYAGLPYLFNQGMTFSTYLLGEAVLMSMAAIFVFSFFRGSPAIPPSYSAAAPKVEFFAAVKSLAKNKNFIVMFFVFGITLGIALSLSVLMDEIVEPAGYTSTQAGTFVSVWISGAIIGGVIGGIVVDRTHAYKPIMLISLSMITVSGLVFTFVLHYTKHNVIVLSFVLGCLGLGAAGIPSILEATLETIYPLPEATAMGILFLGLNVFAVVFTLLGEKLRNSETGSMFVPLLGSVVMMTIATAGVLLFKGDYKRLKFEKMRETEERIKSPAFDRKITLTVK